MIFPIPEDYKGFEKTPVTHILVGLNIIVFFLFFWAHSMESSPSILEKPWFLTSTQKYYREWYVLKYKVEPANIDSNQFVFRGLTDPLFMSELENWESPNDVVQFTYWKNKALEWKTSFTETPLSLFGIKSYSPKLVQWLTYQFSHSDLFHLLSNICFLFVLGLYIERIMGSIFLLGVYLIGGIGGAFAFSHDGFQSLIPMVGASASISAMIAFVAFYNRSVGLRYFFFLAPIRGWYGVLFLPAWLLLPFYLISDLTSYLMRTSDQISGIAHSAHLGGAVVGIFFGILLGDTVIGSIFNGREATTESILGHDDRL